MPDQGTFDMAYVSRCYTIGEISTWERIGGFSSRNYHLTSVNGQYVLKVYPTATARQAERVAQLGSWLACSGLPCPKPIQSCSGAFVIESLYGSCCAVLSEFVDGTVLHHKELGKTEILSVAEIAYTMQKVMKKLPFEHTNRRVELDDLAKSFNGRRHAVLDNVASSRLSINDATTLSMVFDAKEKVLDLVYDILLKSNSSPSAVVHGDFHNENVLFKLGTAQWIIDFEEVRSGWIGEDIITFAIFASSQANVAADTIDKMRPMIQRFKDLTSASAEQMSTSIDATLVRLALSTRIEEWSLLDDTGISVRLLHRDAARFASFLIHREALHEAWS